MRFLYLLPFAITAALAENAILAEFAKGNQQLTSGLYKAISRTKDNFLVCPLAIEVIMSMLYFGGHSSTVSELASTLQLPKDGEKIKSYIRELEPLLQSSQNYTFKSANKIYTKKDFKIQEAFRKIIEEVYRSEIKNVDFGQATETANEINRWVEAQTDSKITDLVDPSVLTSGTRMILVNAMYFHGKWLKKFNEDDTSKKNFYLNNNDHVEKDMMEQTDKFNYFYDKNLKARFLELPYLGEDASLTIVLPDDREGLTPLESNIQETVVRPNYFSTKVHVVMPKFTFKTKIDLNDILKELGIKVAFTDGAQFTDIVEGERLKIDEVIQKTFIEVDEEGTKAAAATGVIMTIAPSLPPMPPIDFIADHPFLFYIKIKDVIAFAGRYVN